MNATALYFIGMQHHCPGAGRISARNQYSELGVCLASAPRNILLQ